MSPKPKHELAREHLDRALNAIDTGDVVVAITFLHLAAEAAIVTLAEREGIPTQKSHVKKLRQLMSCTSASSSPTTSDRS